MKAKCHSVAEGINTFLVLEIVASVLPCTGLIIKFLITTVNTDEMRQMCRKELPVVVAVTIFSLIYHHIPLIALNVISLSAVYVYKSHPRNP